MTADVRSYLDFQKHVIFATCKDLLMFYFRNYFLGAYLNEKNMESINEEYITKILECVVFECKIEKWKYKKETFLNIAQNYFGVIIPISLIGHNIEGEVVLNLVLKLAPTDERYRVSGAVTIFFAKEIFVYSSVLPKYQDIQNNITTLSGFVVPKCFCINNDYCMEVIVMQNMCTEGYHPFTKDIFLDIEHLLLSVKCLAQFHALSFILREQDTALYESAKSTCVPLHRESNKRFLDILKDRLNKGFVKFSNTQYAALFQTLDKDCENIVEAMYKSVNETCLCHGDIWKENLLFKYMDGHPISVCMIDYQTTRMSSPAFDILYLIITATTSHFRRQHFKQLLDTYFQTLEEILREANVSSITYSRQMFEEDLRIVGPACFCIANTAIWLSSGLQQEGHVRSKIILDTEQKRELATNQYKTRIKNIIDDLNTYGYLNVAMS
ncbi:uncharacterized protein LOC119829165 [Zerene cesonia]|uniref:uncharacterized protein LOC119829165 n=1 Tax=Zerene cesonia TaxID=33412 RepID=UPI0018E565A5|nr:uncharacterized protein LOC119829165 [Zerene cesonia]